MESVTAWLIKCLLDMPFVFACWMQNKRKTEIPTPCFVYNMRLHIIEGLSLLYKEMVLKHLMVKQTTIVMRLTCKISSL